MMITMMSMRHYRLIFATKKITTATHEINGQLILYGMCLAIICNVGFSLPSWFFRGSEGVHREDDEGLL